jgi:hypothetical protein
MTTLLLFCDIIAGLFLLVCAFNMLVTAPLMFYADHLRRTDAGIALQMAGLRDSAVVGAELLVNSLFRGAIPAAWLFARWLA